MSTIGGNPLDNSGGVAAYYYIVGDIFGYDCASGDDGIFANGYTRTEDGADADPGILFDRHLSEMEQVMSVVKVVINCCNLNLGPYQHMVFYHHLAR